MTSEEQTKRIQVHEYWMAYRRQYHNVKDGHNIRLTHQEIEEMLYQINIHINDTTLNRQKVRAVVLKIKNDRGTHKCDRIIKILGLDK